MTKRFIDSGWLRIRHPLSVMRYIVATIGLISVSANTVPEIAIEMDGILHGILWLCLGFFATDWLLEVLWTRESIRRTLLSRTALIDAVMVLPVPIAFALGASASNAWLLGSFWLFKLLPTTLSGMPQLARVISKEAKPLASVLIIYLIILFVTCVGIYIFERRIQPTAFGTLPAVLWWGFSASTSGIRDAVPQTFGGHVLAAIVMISGIGVLGLWMGVLANGLMEESRRREFIQVWDLVVKIPFLKSIGAVGIAEIARMLRRLDLPERTTVIRGGSVGDCMYFVVSGEVEVERKADVVRLGAGSFFGEMALLGDYVRNATVTTIGPTTLLVLDAPEFRSFAANYPEFSQSIEQEAFKRNRQPL